MLRAVCLAMTVLVLSWAHSRAETPTDLGANAALKYWQAFATMPKLTDAEQNKLPEYLSKPLDAHVKELVTQSDYSLQMMHYAAALPRCAWGTAHEEGVYVRMPNGSAARVLCNLACLRARLRFEEGKPKEAVDDLVAALIMGRHISLAGTNIMLLVGYAIEHRVYEIFAQELPRLDAKAVKDMVSRLSVLPECMSTSEALRSEEKFLLDWFVRKVKEAKNKESLLVLFMPLFVSERRGEPRELERKASAFLEECGGSAEGVLKFAEESRSSYALVAKKLELPVAEFEKEFEREAAKQGGNPVFKVFFPAMVNVRRAQARIEIRRALFAAALAVQLDGQGALKNHPDPVVGGPFEYAVFDGGYELRSKFKGREDKPVALTVGHRKME
jgi:hypothetical protein